MHNKVRGFTAALLIAVLLVSFPAAAAPRQSRIQRIVQTAKRVVDTLVPWFWSRFSPPGGFTDEEEPPPPPDETGSTAQTTT